MTKLPHSLILLIFIILGISISSSLIQTHSFSTSNSFESFYDFLAKYDATLDEEKTSLLNDYIHWQESAGGFPAIQNSTHVVFIYYNPDLNIDQCSIVGDFTIWDEVNMTKLGSTMSFFYLGRSFKPTSRIDYQFVINGNWFLDPRNPNQSPADVDEYHSELRMPEFIQPQEIYYRTNVSHGSVSVLSEPWTNPQVKVYLPPDYNSKRSYSTVYVADGSCYLEIMFAVNILDNLIADKRIDSIIVVFTDPKDFPDSLQRFCDAK
ncbi:MAG: hypothetical protein HZR80_18225 [Candidatus Heimdallarchaeota archaeon]